MKVVVVAVGAALGASDAVERDNGDGKEATAPPLRRRRALAAALVATPFSQYRARDIWVCEYRGGVNLRFVLAHVMKVRVIRGGCAIG